MYQRVHADHGILGHRDVLQDPGAAADPRARSDHDECADAGVRADLGLRVDHRAGMDP